LRRVGAPTAQQKNITENIANRIGHPSQCNVARNITSTGMVMSSRVIMTSFGLGSSPRNPDMLDVGNNAAACKAVDSRETKMEPTLPGKPGNAMLRQKHLEITKWEQTAYDDGE